MKDLEGVLAERFKSVEAWSLPVFIVLRVLPLLAVAFYVLITPDTIISQRGPAYLLIGAVLAVSFILWHLFSSHQVYMDKLLYVVLIVDLVFITFLVRFTGGFDSEFYLAYFLLASVEAIYFGLGFGIMVALVSSVCYVAGNWSTVGDIYWMHLALRLLFLVAVAALAGFFSASERERREIKRLNVELDKRLAELTTLYEIGKSIHSTLELDKLLSAILDMTSIALRLRAGAVLLSGEDGGLRFVMSRGFPEEVNDLVFDEGDCAGWVMKEGKALIIDDATKEERFTFFKGVKKDVVSLMAVPLVAKGERTGVLCATDPRQSALTEDNLRLLTTVAGQISIAIDNARLYEETKRLSETDGLTGLSVSRTFHNSLESEVKRVKRYGGTLAVLMADMDLFKAHNDEFGHPSGDDVLKATADIIRTNCRSTDVVARYGGEEFAAVLIDTDEKAAMVVAERIRKEVEEHEFYGSDEKPVVHKTISIGLALFPSDDKGGGTGKEDVVKKADEALYRAKGEGRNKVCVYAGSPDESPGDSDDEAKGGNP